VCFPTVHATTFGAQASERSDDEAPVVAAEASGATDDDADDESDGSRRGRGYGAGGFE
jgi:hypothetical protein